MKRKFLKQRFVKSEQFVFLLILLAYGLFYVLKFGPGMAIFGLPLYLYFPGKMLIDLYPPLKFSFGRFGKFSMSVMYSFSLFSILGLYFQKTWGFTDSKQVLGIIITDLIILIASYLLPRFKFWQKISQSKKETQDYIIARFDYLPIAIFALALIIWIIISPLAQNADNFLGIFRQSVAQNFNLLINRRVFVSNLELSSRFLNISDIIIYRYLPVALFFVSSLTFYDYIKRNFSGKFLIACLYLALLAPAVISTEVNNIRPQVMMLVLLIPTLILQIDSLKNKQILASLVALVIAGVSALYHELGFILLCIAFATVVIHLIRLIFVEKKISWKYILLFLIIVYPYTKMIDFVTILHPLAVIKGYALGVYNSQQDHWRWWFLNRFTDVDGVVISFTGKNLLLYYLYNGILLLALLVYTFIVLMLKRIKIGLFIIPAFLYFAFYFIAAEILPRINMAYLPTRAWVNLMMGTVILLVLLIEILVINKIRVKFLTQIIVACLVLGLAGSYYIAKTNIKEVYSEELPATNYIKNNLPADALILSSQYNIGMITIYSNQTKYDQIIFQSKVDKNTFDQSVATKLSQLSKDQVFVIKPKIIQTLETFSNNILTDKKIITLQAENSRIIPAINTGSNPVYFVYSFRKLDALNTADQDRQGSADLLNKESYDKLGYPVVYNDNDVLIIKLR